MNKKTKKLFCGIFCVAGLLAFLQLETPLLTSVEAHGSRGGGHHSDSSSDDEVLTIESSISASNNASYNSLRSEIKKNQAIKVSTITQIRSAIDVKRLGCGLTQFSWTDASLLSGKTQVRAVHLQELRTSIKEMYSPGPFTEFTDPTITSGTTAIRIIHFTELLDRLNGTPC